MTVYLIITTAALAAAFYAGFITGKHAAVRKKGVSASRKAGTVTCPDEYRALLSYDGFAV